jgi:hypothetical protein
VALRVSFEVDRSSPRHLACTPIQYPVGRKEVQLEKAGGASGASLAFCVNSI